MTVPSPPYEIEHADWAAPASPAMRGDALAQLEIGHVLFFPRLAFQLREDERRLLSPGLWDGKAKNISLGPDRRIRHASKTEADREALIGMMERFAQSAAALVTNLVPRYAAKLERARTSFRPVEIEGREYSMTKDDTRLHIDAFPTRPMRGRRILRVFCNINPHDAARVWLIGEPFADMAKKLLPSVRKPVPAMNWLAALVGATKGVRSSYDSIMLGLHDAAKSNEEYQSRCPKAKIEFAAGATWLCFTDQVMHAALAGQYALEQTFYLGIDAMADPDRAPIRVLEAMTGRKLA